ncbi:MAG: alpha/beta hydrolase [Pseudomonadota bacterium]
MSEQHFIDTDFGRIAISDSDPGGSGACLFLIHGNSSLKEVFATTIEAFRDRIRVVAMDLPGHGASADAEDPPAVYTIPHYAEAARAVIAKMGLDPVCVFGWSLGGHIGLEMVAQGATLAGLAICGTPPVALSGPDKGRGFIPSPELSLAGKRDFSEADCEAYGAATVGGAEHLTQVLRDGVRRTDGLARETMFNAILSGDLADEKQLVESNATPLAILDGEEDVFIDHDYLAHGIVYANIWGGGRQAIPGAGHAPFLTHPAAFNPLLDGFLTAVMPPR